MIVRPKTFVGPERLGVFEILFDWLLEGRRIYTLGAGDNRYQLLAVEDLVDAIVKASRAPDVAGEAFNIGAKDFGTVREDLQALVDHAGSSSRLTPVPVRAGGARAAGSRALRVSPLAEWHYKTAHKDSFVSIEKARAAARLATDVLECADIDRHVRLVSRQPRPVAVQPGRPTACLGTSRR